jgi:hypothetical protein
MSRIALSLAAPFLVIALPARTQQADTAAHDSVEILDGDAVPRQSIRSPAPLREMPFRLRFFRDSPAAAATEDDIRSLITAAIPSQDLVPRVLPLEAPLPAVYLNVSVDLREKGGYRSGGWFLYASVTSSADATGRRRTIW